MEADQSASASRVAKLQSVKLGNGKSKPTSAGVRSPRPSTDRSARDALPGRLSPEIRLIFLNEVFTYIRHENISTGRL